MTCISLGAYNYVADRQNLHILIFLLACFLFFGHAEPRSQILTAQLLSPVIVVDLVAAEP